MKNYYTTGLKKWLLMLVVMFSAQMVLAQSSQEVSRITRDYNLTEMLKKADEHKQKSIQEKDRAVEIARENGWDVIRHMPDGSYMELQRVTEDGYPIYYTTFNVAAALSTRTNHLHTGGSLGLNLLGQNMVAHVWDGGIARASHQEYHGTGGTNRFTVGDGSTSLNYHSAHVTGTIIASGVQAAAKGMAPHARAVGYDWNNDLSEATTSAANGMLVSNHSYGYRADLIPKWWFGAYIDVTRDWDNLMRNAPFYLMVVAAGNDGTSNQNTSPLASGYDKLSGHATAKNNLVVANAQDASVATNGNLTSVAINSSSSQGPTDDLRIKPDITGNGTTVYSTYDNSNTAYNSITGTSMASPNVAGTLLLLQQHHNNLYSSYMRAATLKGLVLHTADDAGPTGPDAVWGWGLMNAKRAAETLTNKGTSSVIEERTLSAGQSYSFTVTAAGGGIPLLASVSWTDLPGVANTGTLNDATPRLVNDLDIRITQSTTTHFPWRLNSSTANARGDNNVDPFERVDVANASGTYTITVTHKGTLSGGSQPYSIIVTGIAAPVTCNATVPTGLAATNVAQTTATINWNAVTGATYDVQYRVNGTSTWTTVAASSNTMNLSGLTAATTYNVQVRSKCPNGTTSAYSTAVNFTTASAEITYCASKGNSVADEWIGRVQLNTINNTSGAGGGYQDFTNISTSLEKGVAYTITVTPAWKGTVYAEGYSVWIDFNRNGTFESNEQVFSRSATTATPVSGSFTVPATALNGATRMRVSMKYNGVPTACETFSYGEVEDYSVNIVDASSVCNAPSGLNATNIAQTTATLNWSSAGANSYEARIRVSGTTTWTTLAASGTSLNVTGLQASTNYEFQVRSICTGASSAFSASATFKTTNPVAYCTSKGNNSSYEWISRVKLNEIDNVTGSNSGYGNFTNLVASIQRGSPATINFQAGFSGTTYNEFWKVWIDYNQDGTFGSDELVVSGSSSSSNLLSGTFTVPSSALTGPTRMRVSMKYNAAQTACETFSYGEVEDYTVNIVTSLTSYATLADAEWTDVLGDEPNQTGIMLFPNPTSSELNFNIRGLDTSKPIRIFNVNGALVREFYAGSDANTIDVQSLPAGVYFLRAHNSREEVIESFVIK